MTVIKQLLKFLTLIAMFVLGVLATIYFADNGYSFLAFLSVCACGVVYWFIGSFVGGE